MQTSASGDIIELELEEIRSRLRSVELILTVMLVVFLVVGASIISPKDLVVFSPLRTILLVAAIVLGVWAAFEFARG